MQIYVTKQFAYVYSTKYDLKIRNSCLAVSFFFKKIKTNISKGYVEIRKKIVLWKKIS
jgi:hypothetical protein